MAAVSAAEKPGIVYAGMSARRRDVAQDGFVAGGGSDVIVATTAFEGLNRGRLISCAA